MQTDEDLWPKRIYSFTSRERRKQGRSRKRWIEDVEQAMAARGTGRIEMSGCGVSGI